MVCWGIPHISETTIDEICVREYQSNIEMNLFSPPLPEKDLREVLTKFIGFEANVTFESYSDWIKRQTRRGKMATKFPTQKAVDKELNNYYRHETAGVPLSSLA
jgi:hypothetical protein